MRRNVGHEMLGVKCLYVVLGTSVNHFLQHVRRSTFPASMPCIHALLFSLVFCSSPLS